MKAKNLLFFIVIVIMTVSSCKKDNKNSGLSIPRLLKQTIQYGQYNHIMSYEYDNDFRATKIVQFDDSFKTYNYADSTITVNTYNSTGTSLISVETYTLNSKGLAKSRKGAGSYKAGTWFCKYEYDDTGHLTKEILTSSIETGHTAQFLINNGNMIVETFLASGKSDTIFYEFLSNTINTIGNENMGISFLGKQNVNLFNSMYEKSASHGTSPYTYSYEFDNQNRVTKMTRTSEGNPLLIASYSYVD